MNKLKRFVLLMATTVLTTVANAQILNGDLNHNGVIDVGEVSVPSLHNDFSKVKN